MFQTDSDSELQQWEVRQREARVHMIGILSNALNFLERVDALEMAISTPPGESDARGGKQATDFRNTHAYYYSLQSVWADLQMAMHHVGQKVEFIANDPPETEQLLSLVLDKEIVLEQLIADRLMLMLASPGAADLEELQKTHDSTNARIVDLEDQQVLLTKAEPHYNRWDLQADRTSSFIYGHLPTYIRRVEEDDI
ncbi:hypothetical protein [Lacipirellula sp.]|uniref:hypothetical protein n=1 Tax=Lacipirellula sp. TaxID=2691419 RepID=UPI003D0EB9D6